MASIEEGQDPSITTPNERMKRSGHTKESEFFFYQAGGTGEMHWAYPDAVTRGVDIVNISQGIYQMECNRLADAALNTPMLNALDAGVLTVAAAGNGGHSGSCNVGFPAFRTETLGVGALETGVGLETTPYSSINIAGFSALGGLAVRLHTGGLVTTPGIDLVAPGVLHFVSEEPYWVAPQPNYIEPPAYPLPGTSIAAPVVTGAVAGLLDAFHDIGWTTTNKKALLVNMLLMTDHWDAITNSYRTVALSNLSGAGRLRMHYPSSDDLVAPWGWGWRSFTINQGETVAWTVGDSGPESASITQWKWAALWIEPNLDSVADIDFKVVDTCPVGGGEVVVASDTSRSLRARFDLFQPQISGRCLEMRAYGYSVPTGGRVVYSADYFHGGNPNDH